MKINSVLRQLLPGDEKYFDLLEQAAASLATRATVLREGHPALSSAATCAQLEDRVFGLLANSFLTPLDREDIFSVVDGLRLAEVEIIALEKASGHATQARPRELPVLLTLLVSAAESTQRAVTGLRAVNRPDPIRAEMIKGRQLAEEAEGLAAASEAGPTRVLAERAARAVSRLNDVVATIGLVTLKYT